MRKLLELFVANYAQKNRERITQMCHDEEYYHKFFQIFKIDYLPTKRKNQKLKNLPLLIQYGGGRVKNLAKPFSDQVISNS